jgi:hypothetical protein
MKKKSSTTMPATRSSSHCPTPLSTDADKDSSDEQQSRDKENTPSKNSGSTASTAPTATARNQRDNQGAVLEQQSKGIVNNRQSKRTRYDHFFFSFSRILSFLQSFSF